MIAATVLLGGVIGYRFNGIDGACIGASVAWTIGIVNFSLRENIYREKANRALAALAELHTLLAAVAKRLPQTSRFYGAILNSLPVDQYALHRMTERKTQEQHQIAERPMWIGLRRQLVDEFGLSENRVDLAKEELMQSFYIVSALPTTDKELSDYVTKCRSRRND